MQADDGLSVEQLRDMWVQGLIILRDIPEYGVWADMLQRCYNPRNPAYPRYGGRGIRVYPPWRRSFWAWFAYVDRRGVIPGFMMSIDRIDNDGHYWPGNLKWSSGSEQGMNRSPELTRGEAHHQAKLTWIEVKQIRSLYPEYSTIFLAEMFGVGQSNISRIIQNEMWYDPDWVPPLKQAARIGGKSSASITPDQAGQIKYLLAEGYHPTVIASLLKVSTQIVYNIQNGRWPEIDPIPFEIKWPQSKGRRM